jgi:hypothetical protein
MVRLGELPTALVETLANRASAGQGVNDQAQTLLQSFRTILVHRPDASKLLDQLESQTSQLGVRGVEDLAKELAELALAKTISRTGSCSTLSE